MRWKKNSVLWGWTCSYFLIIFIFLAAVIINYQTSTNVLKEEIVSANKLSFNNASDNVDHLLQLLRKNYEYVFMNDVVGDLEKQEEMNSAFYTKTYQLQDQLFDYSTGDDKVYCMVYLKDKDYLVTGLNSCASLLYHSGMNYLHKDYVDYKTFKNTLSGRYTEDYLVAEGVNYWTAGKSLLFVNTINVPRRAYNILISMPIENVESVVGYLKDESDPDHADCCGRYNHASSHQL